MVNHTIVVPDIGGAEGAEVVELLVAVGDPIELEQSLIVLESDKASMEIPASHAGVVAELKVAVGDQISEGDAVLILEIVEEAPADDAPVEQKAPEPSPQPTEADVLTEPEPVVASSQVSDQIVEVPDIGTEGPERLLRSASLKAICCKRAIPLWCLSPTRPQWKCQHLSQVRSWSSLLKMVPLFRREQHYSECVLLRNLMVL